MKDLFYLKASPIVIVIATIILMLLPAPETAAASEQSVRISDWQIRWDNEEWLSITEEGAAPVIPANVETVWIKFKLPEIDWKRPALMLNAVSAKKITISINDENIYEMASDNGYNRNKILIPLRAEELKQSVIIRLDSSYNMFYFPDERVVGEYSYLQKEYQKHDLLDIILGAAFILTALILLVSLIFLNKSYRKIWGSIIIIILSVGIMLLTNAPYSYTVLEEYGPLMNYGFDIASNLIVLCLFVFFEGVFGRGSYLLINRFKWLQIVFVTLNTSLMLIGAFNEDVDNWYKYYGLYWSGIFFIVSGIVLISLLIWYCSRKNVDAITMTVGFSIFTVITGVEIGWYLYKDMSYTMQFWKIGILAFLLSLVLVFARRVTQNYERVIEYSEKLEIFNDELQRTEKMQIISQLAASIAHEVRNPLQVTRGFLQLLGKRSSETKDKDYIHLAITELDRASEIITDFLTFAKPQVENEAPLNIIDEIKQIEGILLPFATLQGGKIIIELTDSLYVKGNSTKFKQAVINIVKNSIEAFGADGRVLIKAYEEMGMNRAVIIIQDNGEGMNEADLEKLGEPYYSKKSKGTGLGLMVTFRIIEAMDGQLLFKSKKGKGTEAIITLPLEKEA